MEYGSASCVQVQCAELIPVKELGGTVTCPNCGTSQTPCKLNTYNRVRAAEVLTEVASWGSVGCPPDPRITLYELGVALGRLVDIDGLDGPDVLDKLLRGYFDYERRQIRVPLMQSPED